MKKLQLYLDPLPKKLQDKANKVAKYYSHTNMWKHILRLQESNSNELYKEIAIYSLASFIYFFKTNKLDNIFKTCSFCFLTKVNCTICSLSCTKNKIFNQMLENKKELTKENVLLWLTSMNYWEILLKTFNTNKKI